MAIIKCPECGHQVSDKAPTCPSCGVEIAGKVVRCSQCGEVYFKTLTACPVCHTPQRADQTQPAVPPTPPQQPAQPTAQDVQSAAQNAHLTAQNVQSAEPENKPKPKSSLKTPLIVGSVLCLIIIGVLFYFYKSSNDREERRQYDYAMTSTDTLVLRQFLDNYADAPQEWRDQIQKRLDQIKSVDADWNNVLISGSKTDLEEYIDKHPDSPHKAEALQKIDSIDWALVASANSLQAYQSYVEDHPNGAHVDEANDKLKDIQAKTVQPEEKQMVSSLFKKFFQSINAKDEEGLTSTLSEIMTTFLGKTDATRSDAVTFMHKLYHEGVQQMVWRLPGDYKINKKDVGDSEYEYSVNFSANQEVDKTDGEKTNTKYRIQARVNPDGRIAEFNMTRILE